MNTKIEIGAGDNIWSAARKAQELAYYNKSPVSFSFNEIEVIVQPDSNVENIVEIYGLKCDIRRYKNRIKND